MFLLTTAVAPRAEMTGASQPGDKDRAGRSR